MSLHVVLLSVMLGLSPASTEECAPSLGSSIDLFLHSHKNESGHWIVKVDAGRSTLTEDQPEFTVHVHQETRLCGNNETEQLISMTSVFPSLYEYSMSSASTAATPSTTAILSTTDTPSTTAILSTTDTPSTTAILSTTDTPSTTAILSTTDTPSTTAILSTTDTPSTTAILSTTDTPSTTAILSTTDTPSTTAILSTTDTPSNTAILSTNSTPSTITTASSTATPSTPTAPSTTTCPHHSGYQLFPGFSCYKVFPSRRQRKNWSDAREVCRRDGGDLMVLETVRERDEVYVPLYNSTIFYFYPWTGVYLPQGGDSWISVTDEPVASSWWGPGEPDDDSAHKCAAAYGDTGLLRNYDCANVQTFICEIPL